MAKEVKYLKQVVAHLEERYGQAKSQAIMAKARKRYENLIEENSDEPKEYYMHPKLVWGRTKTLGHGGDVCDFRISIK